MSVDNTLVTISTCWYSLKSKFNEKIYETWIKNFLSIVNNFNLVIYTDEKSFQSIRYLIDENNEKIKIIFKPMEEFYTYKYKKYWIKNHDVSCLSLHKWIGWELNMLWNEKVFFVEETIRNQYFNTPYYGWCDIGYFRNRYNDTNIGELCNWSNAISVKNIQNINTHIHYGCVQTNTFTYVNLSKDIENHYLLLKKDNPTTHFETNCFAGGFFLIPKELTQYYSKIYDDKLTYYFSNDYLIKDDQTIIMDIIFTNKDLFHIHYENDGKHDNWFMFQRVLK